MKKREKNSKAKNTISRRINKKADNMRQIKKYMSSYDL